MRFAVFFIACLAFGTGARGFDATSGPEVGLRSFVLFNTQCASCHEGGCSRRMSLAWDPKKAADHIRRYAGKASSQTAGELYHQLVYMKTRCAYFPVTSPLPTDGVWQGADLAALILRSGRGSFVPLGPLETGTYAIRLSLKDTTPFYIEIISQVFDGLLDEQVHLPGLEVHRRFIVEEAGLHYLRLRSKKAVFLKQLELLQEGTPSR